jgi:hypothetical protein
MPALRKEPSDLVLTSTTEPQEALDHAVGENWKQPFIPAAVKAAAEEERLAALKEAEDKKEAEKEVVAEKQDKEDAAADKGDEESRAGDKKNDQGGWSKRVNTLTARNTKMAEELRLERESRERLEARLAALERGEKPVVGDKTVSGGQEEVGASIPDLPGKPVRGQFKSDEEYMEKYVGWLRQNEDHKDAVHAENDRLKAVFDAHRTRTQEARTRYDDYEEVMNDPQTVKMTLHNAVNMAVMEMDNSADIYYFLATHPEEYKKLETMTPLRGIAQMGIISDQIAARRGANGNGAQKKQRVPPPEPIAAGGRRSGAANKPLGDMTTEEYLAARRSMRQARRN